MLKKLAWLYTIGFLGIFLICHTPGFTDVDGKLFGLFRIDPIDDIVHLLSGLAGAVLIFAAPSMLPAYFLAIGILYDLDAVVGMTMSRGLLDTSVFTQGPGAADFSATNWAVNMPHIVLATLAIWIGLHYRSRAGAAAAR